MVENAGIPSDPADQSRSRRSRAEFRKVTVTMPPEQEVFLSKFAFKLLEQGGRKLAVTEIVRATISALMIADETRVLEISEIRDEEQLTKAILSSRPGTSEGH